ncbi:MAG: Flp pilus assembly protein CpaB [Bdellovibrionaceae bacterium]|nr:Flp pilus assembly protein CpaB [Pseudobdellovibrionaceae bacterium]NUM59068.1 Flp pilus assembly protein CpaB [Pseudobdellovibrionaceae bacterium]
MGNESKNLWISIFAGVFAAFMIYSYSQEQKKAVNQQLGQKKVVVVAKEDIAEMTTVYDSMLETKTFPNDYVPEGSYVNVQEIVGNVAAIPIKKGQPILKNHLYSPGADTGIALQVAPTKRAISIPIDETRGVSKLIRPGDRIDIFVALDIGKGAALRRESFLLMQNVVVLATGVSVQNNIPRLIEYDSTGKNAIQTSLTGDTKYSTITIETEIKEAQDLVYILSTSPGNIFITLRNPTDGTVKPRLPSSTADSILARATEGNLSNASGGLAPVSRPEGLGNNGR